MMTRLLASRPRRKLALALIIAGGVLLLLTPGNVSAGLFIMALAVLIELLGLAFRHWGGGR
ncbi:MAG: hypothetical protein ACK443_00410 [Methylococcaceae bacterium]|jgi:hypothetical protein